MPLRPAGAGMTPAWTRRLAQPLTVRQGPTLATLREAADYVLALPAHLHGRNEWRSAVAPLLAAAQASPRDAKAAIAAATEQMELALFLNMRLQLGDKKGPAGSRRRGQV